MTNDTLLHYCTADVFVLGLTIYREAAGEPYEGKVAVAHTVINRVSRPGWWGNTPYAVITKSMQYSSMTARGDAMTVVWPALSDRAFIQSLQAAHDVLEGKVPHPCPGADSYYAVSIPKPKWADESKFVRQIGNHRFYNLDGDPGE